MNYKIFLIYFLISILYTGNGLAQDKRYRVEILVLTHLQHDAEPREATWLRDFSDSLDFLKAPEEEAEGEESNENEAENGPAPEEALTEAATATVADAENFPPGEEPDEELGEEPGEELEEDPLAEVIHVETMGENMQEAWRRLRLSGPFRPEQYLSWEQSADEPFPSLRIHNQEVVLVDDPYADLRAQLAMEELESAEGLEKPIVFNDQGNVLPGEPLEGTEEEAELPDPTLFHQIDGSIMLKRSRFLHLELDLELREALFDEMAMRQALIAQEELEGEEIELPQPSSFLIHSLKQSRQVKTARMEYFDGPVLSVLAYISSVEVEEDPSEQDSSQ